MKKSSRLSAAILFCYALALLLVCGSDGWLHFDYPRYDSAWFFMGGKSLAQGFTPYVDFSDSKGPLLWLIYGLGYLISPNSFHGLFFIEVLFYWATFLLIFRSARLILQSTDKALCATVLMGLAYFFPVIHSEIRAEDFCHLFYAATLYSLLWFGKNFSPTARQDLRPVFMHALYIGVSIGCTLLIKYNIAAILLLPTFLILLYFLLQKRSLIKSAVTYAAGVFSGMLIILLPFAIWFLAFADFSAFVEEYFANTLATIGELAGGNWDGAGIKGYLNLKGGYIALSVLGALSVIPALKVYAPKIRKFLFVTVGSWFVAAFIITATVAWDYYLFNLAVFWIFMFSAILARFNTPSKASVCILGACTICALGVASTRIFSHGEFYDTQKALAYQNTNEKLALLSAEYKATHNEKPAIAYLNLPDLGFHIKGEMVPGVKYWALQSGASEKMQREHITSILKEQPQFLIAAKKDTVIRHLSAYTLIDSVSGLMPGAPEEDLALIFYKTR